MQNDFHYPPTHTANPLCRVISFWRAFNVNISKPFHSIFYAFQPPPSPPRNCTLWTFRQHWLLNFYANNCVKNPLRDERIFFVVEPFFFFFSSTPSFIILPLSPSRCRLFRRVSISIFTFRIIMPLASFNFMLQ